jgi:hypothetical protein
MNSAFWLELIIESDLLRKELVQPLLDEANELAKIMARSLISASAALARKSPTATKSNRQLAIGNRQ